MNERQTEKIYAELTRLKVKRDALYGDYIVENKKDKSLWNKVENLTLAIAERYETFASESHNPKGYKEAAKEYSKLALKLEQSEDFDKASTMNRRSSQLWQKASESEGELSKEMNNFWIRHYKDKSVKDKKRAILYKKTESMHPIKRAIIRKLKGKSLIVLLMLSFFSILSSITGLTIIKDLNFNQPYLSATLFVISLFLGHFYIQQHILSK